MLPRKYNFIPKEQRNKKTAVVITSQFLSIGHSPSNVAVNICSELNKEMGMEVCLINSAESTSSAGKIDMYAAREANFVREFNDVNVIDYKDVKINFFQCSMPMPNLGEIEVILDFVSEIKPYFIVGLGGSNITADLCSAIVPVITYATHLKTFPITVSQFSVFRGGKLTVDDVAFLRNIGKNKDNVIDDVNIPAEVPEPKNIYSRAQFNIPEDKFIVVISGNRLDADISDEVMSFFRELIKNDKIHIVFIGDFTKYNDFCTKYNDFSTKSTCLGYQEDFIGVLTLCDLAVNPKRQGNASVIWAALKGLPIVTFANNDVADIINNEEFYVNSYDEMKNVVYQYVSDTQFYNDMSIKAQKVVEAWYKKRDVKQIIEEMVSRSIFV